jgi:hypothetical protein
MRRLIEHAPFYASEQSGCMSLRTEPARSEVQRDGVMADPTSEQTNRGW